MKILITGAFGNVGKAVIEESHKRGHEIIVFEIDYKKTRKDARKYRKKIRKVLFGDIRNFEDVKKAVPQCDAVIHLAAVRLPIILFRKLIMKRIVKMSPYYDKAAEITVEK